MWTSFTQTELGKILGLGMLIGFWSWLDGTSDLAATLLKFASSIGIALIVSTMLVALLLGSKWRNWTPLDVFTDLFSSYVIKNTFKGALILIGVMLVAAIDYWFLASSNALLLILHGALLVFALSYLSFCLNEIKQSAIKRAS